MPKKYYNNGVINKMFRDDEPIPDGFVLGMVKRDAESVAKSNLKRKQTNLEKYGASAPLQSDAIKEKVKQTNLEKYGVENVSQAQSIIEKRKDTFIERYGVDNPAKSEESKERARQTNLERYGVENLFQSEEIKGKIKETHRQNLGVDYPSQSKEVREKILASYQEHYGVDNPQQSDEIKQRTVETNLDKYGVSYPMMSEEVQRKSRETLMSNYGVDNPMHSDEIKETLRQTNMSKYGVFCTLQDEEVKKRISETCQQRYGYMWSCMRPEARQGSNDSAPNKEFAKILESNSIGYEREFHIGRYSYDFRVEKILVEINPYATHNILWNPFGEHKGLELNYHMNKSKVAEDNGYRCIHIFDWDDVDKILRLLQKRERVYARDCEIREVSELVTNEYLNVYHLQGTCKGQTVRLGLFYNDELVSLMTFGVPRYNKNYEWELLRYCSGKFVVGGDMKLFKHFVESYKPKSVISYCDKAKFNGKVYESLGFTRKNDVRPSKHWYSPKENRHITDNLLRQRGYDQLFNESYGKGTSNEELMIQRGYFPVYDSGQDVWIWG